MSIILKGIDLPKKGTNIVLTIYGRDGTYDAETYPSGVRVKDEAIQIPKEHGDIIDESEAVVTETIDGYYEITATTILEAEE